MAHFKDYYHLAKPGIIYGNALNTLAGFLLAAAGHIDWWLLAVVLVGTSLVIAAGCVYNNFIDQDIDAKMDRTKNRPLQRGIISVQSALLYATLLGAGGFTLLGIYTNYLTVLLGIVALTMYVAAYGIAKRRTVYGTLVGSIPGALPPVAAYTAVTSQLDAAALTLFLILAIWQLPHFYAITMFRFEDYKRAGLPVMSVARGMHATRWHIIGSIILFTLVAPLLTVLGYTGLTYALAVTTLGLAWLSHGLRTYHNKNDAAWGRSMFSFSLIVTLGLAVCLSFGPLLP